MNNVIEQLIRQATTIEKGPPSWDLTHNTTIERFDKEKFAKLVIEETLREVDNRTYGRGENQWYYDADHRWVFLHFGYGSLTKGAK